MSWGGLVFSQFLSKERVLSQLLAAILTKYHYEPTYLDNALSQKVYRSFLEELDPAHKIFTESDLNEFRKHQDRLDNQFQEGSTAFFETVYERYDQRIAQIKTYGLKRLQTPFPLYSTQVVEINSKKRAAAKNEAGLEEIWNELLHHQVLTHYLTLAKLSTASSEEKIPSSAELESKARTQITKEFSEWIKRIQQEKRKDRLERYFDCITRQFDPHSSYLPPEERENFDISMSGKLEGIGAILKEEDGYIKVTSLVVGGPAWRQKELKVNDLIIKVSQGTDTTAVDLTGMRVNEAVKFIRGKKGTLVRLTVKKPNGQIIEVPILRDIVVIEETYAKSSVITSPRNGKKYGYIMLPVFYHNFNENNGRNSADDVRAEIEKLKLAKVEGIILDLRNNSGGALDDAVKMAGLFIEKGPIVQVKNRYNETLIMEDPDPKVIYDGRVLVLINEGSASASEIVAAALQDYHRALIVGSKHSFGKGTVQSLVNLDDQLDRNFKYAKPLGTLKLTIQKFYRITGGSTQFKGVQADIVLPDTSESVTTGEQLLPHALKWDTIKPAKFSALTPNWTLEKLQQTNRERLSKHEKFIQIQKVAQLIRDSQNETQVTLNVKSLWKYQQKVNATRLSDFSDKKMLQVATPKKMTEKEKLWFSTIKKDSYIHEAVQILDEIE